MSEWGGNSYQKISVTFGDKPPEDIGGEGAPAVPAPIPTGAVIKGIDTDGAPIRHRTEERKTALKWRHRRRNIG